MRQKIVVTMALCAALLSASALANDEAGNVHWACHVTTSSGAAGLVMVDTPEEAKARDVASRSKAMTEKELWEPTKSIVECLRMPGAEFADEAFRKFHKGVLM
ncbi:MAG: hypothetical protein AB8C02_07215 [Halioglobus sp.]